MCRKHYSSRTLELLESLYSVFVPQPQVEDCEQAVTLDDAQQAQARAQALWGCMQGTCDRASTAQRRDSIGHYPVEDSSYAGSIFQDGGDEGTEGPSASAQLCGRATLAANKTCALSQTLGASSMRLTHVHRTFRMVS